MTDSVSEFIRGEEGPAPAVTEKPQGLKNILLVGNSFLFYNCGVHSFITAFAKEKGIPMVMTLVGIGGASLYWHDVESYLRPNGIRSYSITSDGTNKVEFIDYPDGKIFDAVVLEDSSQGPIHPGLRHLFEEAAEKHVKAVRKHGAEPFFMLTWAYKDKPEMLGALAEATIRVANANGARVIPCGFAFAVAQKRHPEISLIRSDNRHPTVAGTYLTAAVFFAALTGVSPVGCSFRGRFDDLLVSEEAARQLQEAAWDTVSAFNGWTE
jgi:hypothetical protein